MGLGPTQGHGSGKVAEKVGCKSGLFETWGEGVSMARAPPPPLVPAPLVPASWDEMPECLKLMPHITCTYMLSVQIHNLPVCTNIG